MADTPENQSAEAAKDIRQRMEKEELFFHMTGDGGELRIVSKEAHEANPLNPEGKEGGVFRAIPNFNPTDHPIVDSAGKPFPNLENFAAYSTGRPDKRQLLVNLKTGEVFQPEALEIDGEKKINLHPLSKADQTHLGMSVAKPKRKKMTFTANGAGEFEVKRVDVVDDGVWAKDTNKENSLFLVQAKEKSGGRKAPLKTFAVTQEKGTVYEVEGIERLSGEGQVYKRAIKLGDAVGVFNGGWEEHCRDAFRVFNEHQGPGIVARTKSTVVGMAAAGVTMAGKGVQGVGAGVATAGRAMSRVKEAAAPALEMGERALRTGARFAKEDLPQAVRSHKSTALGLVAAAAIGIPAFVLRGDAAEGVAETVGAVVTNADLMISAAIAGTIGAVANVVEDNKERVKNATDKTIKKTANWIKNIGYNTFLGGMMFGTAGEFLVEAVRDMARGTFLSPWTAAMGAVTVGLGLAATYRSHQEHKYDKRVHPIVDPQEVRHFDYPILKNPHPAERVERPDPIDIGGEQVTPMSREKIAFDNGVRFVTSAQRGDESYREIIETYEVGGATAERRVLLHYGRGNGTAQPGVMLDATVEEKYPAYEGVGDGQAYINTVITRQEGGGYQYSAEGIGEDGAPFKKEDTFSAEQRETYESQEVAVKKSQSAHLGVSAFGKAMRGATLGMGVAAVTFSVMGGVINSIVQGATVLRTPEVMVATVLGMATAFFSMQPGTHAQKVREAQAQHTDHPTRTLGGGTAPAR